MDNDVYNSIDEARVYLNLNINENSLFNEYRLMACAQSKTLFAGHSGNIQYFPRAEKLVGLSIFNDETELKKGLKNLIYDKDTIKKAFSLQYEYAKENREKFNLFVRQQFLEVS